MSEVTIRKGTLASTLIAIVLLFIVAIILSRRAPVPDPRGLNEFLQSLKEGAVATVIDETGKLLVFDNKDLIPVEPCGINKENTNIPETCVRDDEKLTNLNNVTIIKSVGRDGKKPGSFVIGTDDKTYYRICQCPDGTYSRYCC